MPLAEQPKVAAGEHVDLSSQHRGRETILVVEDEPGVRSMVVGALQRQGYTLREADNGFDALELCNDDELHVDMLLTDVVMPEMNGRQLAEVLQIRFPDLKVMFMSGYTDDAVIRHGILQAEVAYLQKPFTPTLLAQSPRSPRPRAPRRAACRASIVGGLVEAIRRRRAPFC